MVKSQIGSLTPDPSFGHNLCFKYPNGSCKPILDIYISRALSWCKELFNPMSFDALKLLFEYSGICRNSNSQNESSLGSVWAHSFTLSYILVNMKCDSRASLSAHTFASICLSHEPKAKVVTQIMLQHVNKHVNM